MKVGATGLKMSSGEVRHFKSPGARARFEKVAKMYSHGWKGPSTSSRKKAINNAFDMRRPK
jgi:hypothetical protein